MYVWPMKYAVIAMMFVACGSKDAENEKVNETIYNTEKAIEDSKKRMQDLEDSQMFRRRMDSVNRGYKVRVN